MISSDWLPLTEPLPLSRDVVHVVLVALQADDLQLAEFRAVLSSDELARADRYKIERPRRHFIICRAILRRLLGSCIGQPPETVEFEYGNHGKPSLRRSTDLRLSAAAVPRVEFSVSHSADLALIAITSDRRVGVDVEQMNPAVRILKLASRFFSPRETAELIGLPESDQLAGFYRGWTCKEAYLKATGFGLSFPLNRFTVSMNPRVPAALHAIEDQPEEPLRWQLMALDTEPDFAAAMLLEAAIGESLIVRRWIV
jgi:4'-phosphopantetheinyl transferase